MRIYLAGICFSDGQGAATTYDPLLVITSYFIAAMASYAALEMAGRMRAASASKAPYWQIASSVALGGGIWSMHFMAMLAMHMPTAVTYGVGLTFLSLLIAIAVVMAGLQICGRWTLSIPVFCVSGAIIGLGVAAMHYIGMAAMIFPGTVSYHPTPWTLSVMVAIAAAIVALWLSMTLQQTWQRWIAAIVMATAVCGMHYLGMAAAVFEMDPFARSEAGAATGPLAISVAAITLSLIVLALILVAADRRLLAGLAREMALQEAAAAAVAETSRELKTIEQHFDRQRRELELQKVVEQLLSNVFMLVDAPMAIVTGEGEFLMTNPSLNTLMGYARGELIGQPTMKFASPMSRQRLTELRDRQMSDRKSYSVEAQFLHRDGSVFRRRLTSAIAEGEALRRFRIITLGPPESDQTAAGKVVTAGKIRFIGLDKIRGVLGDGWTELAESIMAAAIRIVSSRLRHGEVVAQSGDCSLVVRFAGASEEFASERAAAIEAQLHQALIGLGHNPSTIDTLVATISTTIPADASPGRATEEDIVEAALDAGLERAQRASQRRARYPFRVEDWLFEPVLACGSGNVAGHFIRHSSTDASLSTTGARRVPSTSNARLNLMEGIESLKSRTSEIGTHDLMFVDNDSQQLLQRQALNLYLIALQNVDSDIRARLVIMLSEWPAGLPFGRIVDLASSLKPLCHAIGFGLAAPRLPKFDLASCGANYIGINARGLDQEAEKDGKLAKLVLQLHARRARVLVREARSASIRAIRSAGADYVSMKADGASDEMADNRFRKKASLDMEIDATDMPSLATG